MSEKEPFYRRHTFGYVSAGLLVAFMSTWVFAPLRDWLLPNPRVEVSPTPTATPAKATESEHRPAAANKNSNTDIKAERLREQYDSLNSRFTAVEASLRQRMADLGSQPVKPQITAAIQTARSDLANTKNALAHGDLNRAKLRLQRIADELRYLESL